MRNSYSLYEAKARFSEIIRAVRERGETVTVSYHGDPVAEIRPIASAVLSVAQRIEQLEAHGVLLPAEADAIALPPAVGRRRGALKRFMQERDA